MEDGQYYISLVVWFSSSVHVQKKCFCYVLRFVLREPVMKDSITPPMDIGKWTMVSYLKNFRKLILGKEKKSWEPFRNCLPNSTSNPTQFVWKWARLAVLFM